jgi:hypothetical protein
MIGLGTRRAPGPTMVRSSAAVISCALLASAALSSCRSPSQGPANGLARSQRVEGPVDLQLAPLGAAEHRILLDARVLQRLRDSARQRTQAWKYASARCEEQVTEPVESGYQGFEWADAVAGLALCWNATGEARYATSATRYLGALLDDRFKVGDGKGGSSVVTHDSGYGIRTFAAYSALGYDWLRDAPDMSPALRARVVERLDQWLTWYGKHGYLRDHAIANYYWGYLAALSFAGLAVRGDVPVGDTWLQLARDELGTRVLPTFKGELVGGGWPEGWQYGEYTTVEIALVAKAFQTGAGVDLVSKLPWLGDVVSHHVHALLPDEESVYDGGTWGEHPAKPSALALTAVSLALDGVDDARAAEARWMTAHALPPLRREQAWVGLLADQAGAAQHDPHSSARTSLQLSGQGLTFVRSDWSKSAVWASFQAGPWLSEDHQDADQGHFELWRGADGLLVDGGDSEGSATSNHNTLLIDDGGRHLNYSPNQGVWGKDVRTTRFWDDGAVVVVAGDIGEAYAPSCAEDGCTDRSVERLVRTLVYVRPSMLVIDDRISLERDTYGAVWAAHVTTQPVFTGDVASAVVGTSRVDVRTLEPANADRVALREPTPSGEGPHRLNHPWGPMWRLEVTSPLGSRQREFLHFITVDRADAAPPPARRIVGVGLHGAEGNVLARRTLVLFADSPEGADEKKVVLDSHEDLVMVVGLEPGRRYGLAVDSAGDCTIRLRPSSDASGVAATPGGSLRVDVTPCGLR